MSSAGVPCGPFHEDGRRMLVVENSAMRDEGRFSEP